MGVCFRKAPILFRDAPTPKQAQLPTLPPSPAGSPLHSTRVPRTTALLSLEPTLPLGKGRWGDKLAQAGAGSPCPVCIHRDFLAGLLKFFPAV